ncbi:hypothetical protein ACKWTF_000461 [Chironomus riparius]
MQALNEALKTLSLSNYGPHATIKDDLIKIEFKINESFDDKLDEKSFSHFFGNDKPALITFQCTVNPHINKIFWKVIGQKSFNLLEISDDSDGTVTRICQNFLLEKLRNEESGILKSSQGKKVYEVHDIGNNGGHNLLIDAVTQNNSNIVLRLLKHNFDLDLKFKLGNEEYIAVDKAWVAFVQSEDAILKKICSDIILLLLRANSKFPDDFNYDIASDDIKDFIADCEELRDYVDSDDVVSLTNKIQSSPDMSLFYDEYNESLMVYTLRHKKQKIYDLLASLDLNIGCHEICDLREIYLSFEARQRRALRNRNQANAKQFPKTHILILKSKSKIGSNDRDSKKHWKCINEAYEIIDQNEGGSKILQIVSTCKGLKIFFDFKHDSTYYFDPFSSANSSGITYTSGLINIGARNLLKEDKKYKVIGVIAHEFCHLSILMSYMNNFDPYQMGDYEDKTRFIDKVAAECEKNQDFEKLVGNVYKLYPKHHQHSELIVLVLQLMMIYYIKDPKIECENSKIIADRMKNFAELFNYFKEVVEPELVKSLPILKKLQDNDQNVTFEELTQSMKAKILHSNVKFQGIAISLFEVIGNDEEILKLLPSEDLKDILLDRECFHFGDVCRMSAKYGYIERNFIKFRTGTEAFKFEVIKNLVDTTKILILTGKAGSGKTTTFENLSKKLKAVYKSYWISFIRLRNFREVFEEFSMLNIDPNLEQVITLLCKILFPQAKEKNFNFDDDFEVRIFKKLFLSDQVILLFDGIDEICPRFNNFVGNTLKLLKEKSKIQLWISTRPQHVDQFEEKFNIESYTLEPYSRVNQRMMITEIFKKADNVKDKSFELLYTNVCRMFKKYQDFNNPLIIVIMTELYISGKIGFEMDSIDLYEIYEKLIDAQVEKVEKKIDSKERSIFLNFKLLFQVLALKFIFEDKDLKKLSIIKKWKKEKKNWTAEKIQRFGFVIVDLSFLETDDRNSIDYIHKTFAEFFVVQFIVEAIFNDDEDIRKDELEMIFQLVKFLASEKNDSFLLSFLNNKSNITGKCLQNSIKELISRQIEKNINSNQMDSKTLVFWSQFLQNEPEALKKLWKGTGNRSLFMNMYFYRQSSDSYAIISLIHFMCDCLGDNWDKTLINKNTDYINKLYPWGKIDKRTYDKNFYKLLHFIEENFSKREKKLFWRDFFCYFQDLDQEDLPEDSLLALFDEIYKLYPNEEGILLHIIKRFLCKDDTSMHITSFITCLQKVVKNDHVKIQKVLFSKTVSKALMTNLSHEHNNDFEQVSSLYINYKVSWDDVQNLFLKFADFFGIFKVMRDSQSIFIEQLRTIFESNRVKLIEFISSSKMPFSGDVFTELEIFVTNIFNGDENFIIQGMRSILYRNDKFNDFFQKLGAERIQNIPNIINIYRKYQSSQEEFTNFFKSWSILSEIFFIMTGEDYNKFKTFIEEVFATNKKEIFNCIQYSNWNQTIYFGLNNIVFLEKFAADFFAENEDDHKEFIKKVIMYSMKDTKYHKINFYEHLLLTFYSENPDSFKKIWGILTKHLTLTELKEQFLNQNIYCKAFGYGQMKLPNEFLRIINEIFGPNVEEILSSTFCPDDHMNLVLNQEYYKNFLNITTDLFGKDGNHVKIFIKKMFFNPEKFQEIFTMIVKFYSISGFRHLLKILNDFKDNHEELQNIFISCKDFLNIFVAVKEDFYPEFEIFVTEIFKSNKSHLLDCINYSEGHLMIENVENLKIFEDFLTKFFENDENLKIECLRKILFAEYSAQNFPLVTFIGLKHVNKFKMLRNFYKSYKTSWGELQAFFASKQISSLIFNQMTEESYLLFKELTVEIYRNDKTLLRESYKSIKSEKTAIDNEDLYNSDIDYSEEAEQYYFDLDVVDSFRQDFEDFVYGTD